MQGTRAELLTGFEDDFVEADDLAGLDAALHRYYYLADGDRRLVEADSLPLPRGDGLDLGVALRLLAPAEDASLERLFFDPTTSGTSPQSPQTDSIHPELAGGRMSTTTLTAPIRVNIAGFTGLVGRLVVVELRKIVDTRAGFWLQVATVALTVIVVVVRLLVGDAAHHTFQSVLDAGLQPAAILLPVLGILLVTSEWSQRTGLITFALVPVRWRFGAKLIGSLLWAVAMLAMSLAVVVAGVLVAAWSSYWSVAAPHRPVGRLPRPGWIAPTRCSAPSCSSRRLVIALRLRAADGDGAPSLPVFSGVAPCSNNARALGQMTATVMSATQWAHAGTSLAIWMVLPLLIGARRITRRQVTA